MRKTASLLVLLVAICFSALGQTRKISGVVTDEKGESIPGATIRIKNSKLGTAANGNGQFSIAAKTGDVLIVSGAGLETTEAKVGAESDITIKANRSIAVGTEVVVTALGIKRQQRDLGYATAKVSNEVLTQSAPVNALNGLQGKVSGVNIATMNNSVFEDVKVNIRGIRSLAGDNNPLFLLDGIPTPITYFASINPNDITDVTVLKGSGASAIYGPDARNGAIVVTTKRGTKSDKVEVALKNTTQFSQVSFFPSFQTQFGSGGYGDYVSYENWSWGPAFDGSSVPLGSPLKDGSQQTVVYSPNNSRKKFFDSGITNQTDLSVNGKDFFLSLQDVHIKGIVPGDKNRRTGIRLNSSKEFGKFRVNVGMNYVRSNFSVFDDAGMANYNTGQNVGLNSGLLNLIFNTPAQVPLTDYKDWKNNQYGGFNTYFNHYGINPYTALDNWRKNGLVSDLLASLEANYKVFQDLNITWRVASSLRNRDEKGTSVGLDEISAINVNTNTAIPGYVNEQTQRDNRLSSELFASYTKSVKKFKFSAILGTYVRQTERKRVGIGNTALAIPGLYSVNNLIGEYQGKDGRNQFLRSRIFSTFGSVGVGFSNWLNLEFTGRTDKVSWLDPAKNSYFYPGASASIVVSDLVPSIKSDFLNYFKLRFSWNKTGNADRVDLYALAPTFTQTGGFPYGSIPGYSADNDVTDPSVKPEFIETYEIGGELNILKNKISIGVAYYENKNTNQIIPVAVSRATGYSNATVNAASFINKGVEFDLNINQLFAIGDFKTSFSGTLSYNDSRVLGIYPGLDRVFIGGFANAANYAVVNLPAMTFLVKDYLRDPAGRVIVDVKTGLPTANPNTTQIGRTSPLWVMGLVPSFSYKNIKLSIVAEYKTGHMGYGRIGNEMAWTGVSKATAYNNRERFVIPNSVYFDSTGGKYFENKNITINDVTDFYTGVYRQAETNFLYDASSWRIREVSLSYDLPRSLFNKVQLIKGASFTVNARNLFLWVPKSNQYTDPDFNFDGGNSNGVTTSSINPPVRTIGVSFNVNF